MDVATVVLTACADSFECDVLVALLRSHGIEASASVQSARSGARMPTGNLVYVRREDAERAAEIIADSFVGEPGPEPKPPSRATRLLWRLLGGREGPTTP